MDRKSITIQQKKQSRTNLGRRIVLIGGISIVSILSNFIPEISIREGTISFPDKVLAQNASPRTFSLETIWRYAAAVQEINPIREEHNAEINQLLQFNRPSRVCYQNNIPAQVKQSCNLFGSKMFNILRKHEIDEVYTPISIQVQSDDNLKRKIQKAGVCQQRGISLDNCF